MITVYDEYFSRIRQAMSPIQTILSESGVLAVAKPAGLATQAPPGCESVEARVREMVGSQGYVGMPHRLDRAVSGVLLVALTPRAARKLSRQFERRQVRKIYRAIVEWPGTAAAPLDACGATRAGRAEWRDLVEKVPDEPRARLAADPDATGVREAVTLARVLGPVPGADGRGLVELEPLTGRMHQLRLQAAARGMPIVGDVLYGGPVADLAAPADAGDPRTRPIALHAWRIEWSDPDTGRSLAAEAPLPAWWPAGA